MKTFAITALCALLFAGTLRAEIIAYEPFMYSGGNGQSIVGEGTGTGWGGEYPTWYKDFPFNHPVNYAVMTRHSTHTNGFPQFEFNYTDGKGVSVPTSGKTYARFADTRNASYQGATHEGKVFWWEVFASRTFAETNYVYVGESVWFSVSALQRDRYDDVSRRVWLSITGLGASWNIVGNISAAGNTYNQWGIRAYVGTKDELVMASPVAGTTIPDFLVARLTVNSPTTCTVSLWINPADTSSVSALGTSNAYRNNINISHYAYHGFRVGVSMGRTLCFDEVRVGTTLKDVIKYNPYGPTMLIIK